LRVNSFFMDIVLLSKMVKELILDNDKVTLPGLGSFVAEIVPSSFSDRGYTINPPYRRVFFKAGVEQDTLLAEFYAANNSISLDMSKQIVGAFINELGKALDTTKAVQLPGLGRLRTGRDGNVFFVADEELDIYPAGFGLEPISLKTHVKPTSFDFSTLDVPAAPAQPVDVLAASGVTTVAPAPVAETPVVTEKPAVQPAVEVVPAPAPAPVPTPAEVKIVDEPKEVYFEEELELQEEEKEREWEREKEKDREKPKQPYTPSAGYALAERARRDRARAKRKRKLKKWLTLILTLVLIAAIVVGTFYVMVFFFPDTLDKILYSKEELYIINYYK